MVDILHADVEGCEVVEGGRVRLIDVEVEVQIDSPQWSRSDWLRPTSRSKVRFRWSTMERNSIFFQDAHL